MSRQSLSVDEALKKARQLAKTGNINAAGQLYQQILSRQPQNKKARKALKALQQGTSGVDQHAKMQSELSHLMQLYEAGRLDQALTLAQQSGRKYPDQPMSFNIAGVILAGRDDHDSAVAQYKRALELAPNYVDAYSNLAASLHKLGQLEQARHNYLKAIQLNPKDPDIYFNLGNVLQDEGDYEQAAASYNRAINLRPLHCASHIQLGNALTSMGKTGEAVASYRNTLDIDHKHVEARIHIGNALLSQKQFEPAIIWFQEALDLEPENSRAHLQLAIAKLRGGMREEAIASFKECLKYEPGSLEAQHFLNVAENNTTESASPGYVRDLFDDYSPNFERHLRDQLGYEAPEILRNLVDEYGDSFDHAELAIDLGCGTGLSGEAFRDICKTLTGIDLSSRMLGLARKKGVYDSLILGDFTETISEAGRSVDLFICADALIYIGKLEKLFGTLSEHCHAGTLFAFSIELEKDSDLKLLPSGRYAHGRAYVERVAESTGFELLAFREAPLRKESGSWLSGGYYLLRYCSAN